MSYFDEDDIKFDTLLDAIRSNACVLLLGPLFGVDECNHKIHDLLNFHLVQNHFHLDTEYLNLFVKKSHQNDFVMANAIAKFYRILKVSSIYSDISTIKFSSIITFTQDKFLNDAFTANKFAVKFNFYGQKTTSESGLDKDDNIPIIFNVHGDFEDVNSLITNYDTYYRFIFSLLSDQNFFPHQLNKKITDARVLLFLGFDFKYWSVPLIITRIYNIGKPNKNASQIAIAALDDTDTTNEAYVEWMKRYPLELESVKSSTSLLSKIIKTGDETLFRKPEPAAPIKTWRQDIEFLKLKPNWVSRFSSSRTDDLPKVLDDLIDFFKYKEFYEQENLLLGYKAQLIRLIAERNEISKDITIETNVTFSNVLKYINNNI